jgi:hypothetical protein
VSSFKKKHRASLKNKSPSERSERGFSPRAPLADECYVTRKRFKRPDRESDRWHKEVRRPDRLVKICISLKVYSGFSSKKKYTNFHLETPPTFFKKRKKLKKKLFFSKFTDHFLYTRSYIQII